MKIFVYGSLKRGFGLHGVLRDAKFVGTGNTGPHYDLVNLGSFPGMIKTEDNKGYNIFGEVYEIDEYTLKCLDGIEGHPNFFRREKTNIAINDTVVEDMWTYIYQSKYGNYISDEIMSGAKWWREGYSIG